MGVDLQRRHAIATPLRVDNSQQPIQDSIIDCCAHDIIALHICDLHMPMQQIV
jgi:hypothetical protein